MAFTPLIIIIVITTLVSLHAMRDDRVFDTLHFSAYRIKHDKEYHRFITNILIHADLPHLIFNMFSLYFLGEFFELVMRATYGVVLGEFHFVAIYLLGGLFANLYAYMRHQDDPNYRSVGASGAVSAIIFAVIIWVPDLPLNLMFIPIPIPAYIFGVIYLAFEYYAHKKGNTGIAHDAHIGGAVLGIVYVLILNIDKGKEFLGHFF
jgi:membrane associated rhomboid family serine protease